MVEGTFEQHSLQPGLARERAGWLGGHHHPPSFIRVYLPSAIVPAARCRQGKGKKKHKNTTVFRNDVVAVNGAPKTHKHTPARGLNGGGPGSGQGSLNLQYSGLLMTAVQLRWLGPSFAY